MQFSVEISRHDEYLIMVDETVWTPEEIKKWAESFYPARTPNDIAELLAKTIMKLGSDHGFYEGFGYVKMYYRAGTPKNQYNEGFKLVTEEEYTKGLSATLIYEDEGYEIDLTQKN